MEKFNRKNAQKYVKRRLKEVENLDLNMEYITQGKDYIQLAWLPKSLENFKKRIKRAKEKVREENKKKEEIKRNKRKLISNKTLSIVKNNLNIKPTKTNIKRITQLEADKFFNRYFKSVLNNTKIEKKLNKLKRRFGNRLDLLHDFIDKVLQIDFNYEIDGIAFSRQEFESDFADNWDDMMEERLDRMFTLLNKKEFMI